jgi:hypothetical protein
MQVKILKNNVLNPDHVSQINSGGKQMHSTRILPRL